jgi:hypothetical protein
VKWTTANTALEAHISYGHGGRPNNRGTHNG